MANTHKYVYLFSEGNGSMRELLGGKGANLAEMTNLGMPVPQGFTVTTEACTQYYNDGRQINADIQAQIYEYLGKMEAICGKKFADPENPPVPPAAGLSPPARPMPWRRWRNTGRGRGAFSPCAVSSNVSPSTSRFPLSTIRSRKGLKLNLEARKWILHRLSSSPLCGC